MQTPKSKAGTLEVPKKKSPASTLKAARQLKPGSDADSLSSPNQASRTPKDRSPKIVQRTSPQSPLSEKKRTSKMSDLETQLAKLQDDLKKTKDQLNASESLKKQAQQEAEDAKKHVIAMSAKLEESQQKLHEISASDDDRIQELRKLSHERDKAWQSELEAVQKQHESAMNEIQKLKAQLSTVSESESHELGENRSLVEKLKAEIFDTKESEAQARETLSKTEMQLDIVNTTAEILRSDNLNAKETLNALSFELEQSKAHIQSLEAENEEKEANQLNEELERTKHEVTQLKSALDAAEIRYQEEYIQSTLQIRNAYELVELTKSEHTQKKTQLIEELNTAKTEIEDLRALLHEKETESRTELKQIESDLADLKAISEENEMLKLKITKMEIQQNEVNLQAIASLNQARNNKQDAKLKLTHQNAESDKIFKNAARLTEQLDAAMNAKTEMEAEMRKLKVQTEQWRKAAEAAAAMLTSNGKIMERTGSLDSSYYNPMAGRTGSPCSDEIMEDDSSPKKKNVNMMKKIGGLWKKGHP